MKRKLILVLIGITMTLVSLQAQKKPLNPEAWDSWKSVRALLPSNENYLIYNVYPEEGDSKTSIYDIKNEKNILSVERMSRPVISLDAKTVVYSVTATFKQKRAVKLKKTKKAPEDTLHIFSILNNNEKVFPFLKKEQHGKYLREYIAFQIDEKAKEAAEKKAAEKTEEVSADTTQVKTNIAAENKKIEKAAKDSTDLKKPKKDYNPLYVMNINTLAIDTIHGVQSYSINNECDKVFYINYIDKKDSLAKKSLIMYDILTSQTDTIITGDAKAKIELPQYEDKQDIGIFYAQLDTAKAEKDFQNLYAFYGERENHDAILLADKNVEGIPEGYQLAGKSYFARKGKSIVVTTSKIKEPKDTTIADIDRVDVQIWKWDADFLPTMEVSKKAEHPDFDFIINLDPNKLLSEKNVKLIQIEDDTVPSVYLRNGQDYILETTYQPYVISSMWDYDVPEDIYKISLLTGKKELVKKKVHLGGRLSASPDGNTYVWFDSKDRNWFQYNMSDGSIKNLTKDLGVAFYDVDNDIPANPRSYAFVEWFENSSEFLIRDKYDYWCFDVKGDKAPHLLTNGFGRKNNTVLKVEYPILNKEVFTNPYARSKELSSDGLIYFSSLNKKTKENGYYMMDLSKRKPVMTKIFQGPYSLKSMLISLSDGHKKLRKPTYAYIKSNFETSPDVYITKNAFKDEKKITDINPQQKDYSWGTAELINYKVQGGKDAQGMIFKPENFDPNKKYPMLIYFYEKNSDTFYNYRIPHPSHSIINITEYVSNGYLVLVPDVYFEIGHPGKSGMNSIMAAVDKICENPWVDQDNMALEGQSWGGYLTAYMVTQTDRFKCAEAGAPVSNMTSAYGGIRWGSGVVREPQYEDGQSRIGTDLWSGFDLYVENSPLFFAPNVKTPLLIMANDHDDAVPWYQGIEYFTALRRLGKPAWMLTYKGEVHNLMQRKNCKDLSIKLAEYFDYYLKGAEKPSWM